MKNNLFQSSDSNAGIVRAVAIYSGATKLAELAGHLGFEAIWVEMEHGHVEFSQVEHLGLAADATGTALIVRVPDTSRSYILRALEAGAQMVVVPGVNTAQEAATIVRHGKFSPLGSRGFHGCTRGLGYGLMPMLEAFAQANDQTHIIAQIETREAIDNLDAILAVAGLSGILVGPGDLSMSLGIAGELNNPCLIEKVADCIGRARAAGKHAGIFAGPGLLRQAAMKAGCDLVVCGSDVSDLKINWKHTLDSVLAEGQS